MRLDAGQAMKRLRAFRDGSMADRRCRENMGRLRSVEGTERETAPGTRAEVYAACGRMSSRRVDGSLSQASRAAGATESKAAGEGEGSAGGGGDNAKSGRTIEHSEESYTSAYVSHSR